MHNLFVYFQCWVVPAQTLLRKLWWHLYSPQTLRGHRLVQCHSVAPPGQLTHPQPPLVHAPPDEQQCRTHPEGKEKLVSNSKLQDRRNTVPLNVRGTRTVTALSATLLLLGS